MYPEISHELRNQNSLNFLTCKTLKTLYNKNKHPVSFRTQNFVVSLKTAYIEGSLPNDSFCNVPLYDVIEWISTASTDLDQRQLDLAPPTDSQKLGLWERWTRRSKR